MTTVNLVGQIFGRLTVISEGERSGKGNYIRNWNCVCDCGGINSITQGSLIRGLTNSCGCIHKEVMSVVKTTHGESKKGLNSREYRIWSGIKTRCYNTKNKRYNSYGGRGIKVCDRWLNSFEIFLSDMGRRPSTNHSIDRIDVNADYEPSNCKWATTKEQSRNTTKNHWIEFDGRRQIITDWATELGTYDSYIGYRLKKGIPFETIYKSLKEKQNAIFT